MPHRLIDALLLSLMSAVMLGCQNAPNTPPVAPKPPAVLENNSAAPYQVDPLPESPPQPGTTGGHVLIGKAVLPKTISGLANVQNGVVSGTTAVLNDAYSGREIARGVTYYDGSFRVVVPEKVGRRSAILSLMLVDSETRKEIMPLSAGLILNPALGEQRIVISPGTTVWVALLTRIAALQTDKPAVHWTAPLRTDTSIALSSMIAGADDETQMTFATYAEGTPELIGAQNSAGLLSGIQTLVDRLVAGSKASS